MQATISPFAASGTSSTPTNIYTSASPNICKIKIRKNFKNIQLKNQHIVSNPFAQRTP